MNDSGAFQSVSAAPVATGAGVPAGSAPAATAWPAPVVRRNGAVLPPRQGLLFTGFEPSGDDHAAIVIAELRKRHPDLPIYAWGGPKMEAAGATIVERTGEHAVMGIPGVGKIIEHIQINRRIEEWLDRYRVAVHIPVDSPDANFPICAMAKERGIRVVHLVAPQLWAWREGRIKKLRRLSDLVLCLLPFEEHWFLSRGVPAKFVGHPLFDVPLDVEALDQAASAIGAGQPKIALMPGSRPSEVKRSFFPLFDAFKRLKKDFPTLRGCFAVTRPAVEAYLRQRVREMDGSADSSGWPDGLSVMVGQTDAVIRWCDFALVASGTVTLQVARQHKPMVTFYRFGKTWRLPLSVIGRLMFTTRLFTLPNLIAGKRIIPELVPHYGDGEPLAIGVYRLLRQPGYADDQRAALEAVCKKFEGHSAAKLSADAIEQIAGLKPAVVG